MGAVAVCASLFDRVMLEFCGRCLVADVLVTSKTEVIPRLQQIELIVGRMGVMTVDALALQRNFMHAPGVCGNNVFMTLETYFTCIRGQLFIVVGRMRVMTAYALTDLYRRMNKGFLQLLLKIRMTAQTKLPVRAGLQMEGVVLRVCNSGEDDRQRGKNQN